MRSPRPNADGAGTHLEPHADGIGVGLVSSFPTFPLTDQRKGDAVEPFQQAHHFLCVFTALFQLDVLDPVQQKPCRLPANHLGDLESHQHGKLGKLGLSHLRSAALAATR